MSSSLPPTPDNPTPDNRAADNQAAGVGADAALPLSSRAQNAQLRGRLWALAPVTATCVGSLVALREQLSNVAYLNDTAVHEEMVAAALAAIRSGHFPPSTWFPWLNLGSPQFLHYQPLAAMLAALLAWVVGPGHAVALTTWLLVGCWPLCIYGAARLFGLGRSAAAAAALLSPFLSSPIGVGYEQISYLWAGYGLWSQLFAMWTLPFAWAFAWRAVEEGRFVVAAAVSVAATAALHFETGYLAFLGVVVFVVVRPASLGRRTGRGALVVAGAIGLDAWAIVPLIAQGRWAAINQFLRSGPEGVDANSYGAGRVLSWLVSGNLLDWHHLELLTPLFAVGLACCLLGWRHRSVGGVDSGAARAIVGLFALSLLLFFGRPTLGPLLFLLPGSTDLFLRRFLVGVELAALLLAGIGGAALALRAARGLGWMFARSSRRPANELAPAALLCCAAGALLWPAWSYLVDQADRNAANIAEQASAAPAARQLDLLLARVSSDGGGRVFAGDPSDGWGPDFTVGEVAVFKYLAAAGIDEVGFTVRTASLMSGPEVAFDETNPADYALFGVRWIVLPTGMTPPVPARLVERQGRYTLFQIASNGYLQVVDTRGSVSASSGNLGSFAATFLASLPSSDAIYPTVTYGGTPAAVGTLPASITPVAPAGAILSEDARLSDGEVRATITARRPAVVLLSCSYDPGWQVEVDGHAARTEMVAPALVGVRVPAGRHTVRFIYVGFPDYPQLFGLGLAALGMLFLVDHELRRRRLGSAS